MYRDPRLEICDLGLGPGGVRQLSSILFRGYYGTQYRVKIQSSFWGMVFYIRNIIVLGLTTKRRYSIDLRPLRLAGRGPCSVQVLAFLHEALSKLLASPLRSPTIFIFPYIIPYIPTPLRSLDPKPYI